MSTLDGFFHLRVIIHNAINLVLHINSKRHAVKALIANATPETARVVALPHRLQNHLHDWVLTNSTLLRCLLKPSPQVIFFAVHSPVNVVESFAAQCPPAGATDEAVCVVKVAHCLACLASACHSLSARVADAEELALFFFAFHFFF